MPKCRLALFLIVSLCCALAPARAELNDRLNQQRFGNIPSGAFSAGDQLRFTLSHFRSEYLMKIVGEPEVFVLYADYGSLGGRVLRYDSGAVAIQVAGWGSMTLYTDSQPEGLPALRIGDAADPQMPGISAAHLRSTASDEAAHIAYVRGVHIVFAADWDGVADDADQRALLYDTLENTARGVARFAAIPAARDQFGRRISVVQFKASRKPTIQIVGRTLFVTYNPRDGFRGRASSRAIAYALGKLFRVPVPN